MKLAFPKLLEHIARGRLVILTDDEKRENEGDFVCAAGLVTPEIVNVMISCGRGLLCVALDHQIVERLKLAPMTTDNESQMGTNFTVSVGAKHGISTGISTRDRAHTILTLAHPKATRNDLCVPGHIFPLKAHSQGLRGRQGHTEGSVELMRLAGLMPAAAICEVLNADGTMARLPELEKISDELEIPIVSIAEVMSFISQMNTMMSTVREAKA